MGSSGLFLSGEVTTFSMSRVSVQEAEVPAVIPGAARRLLWDTDTVGHGTASSGTTLGTAGLNTPETHPGSFRQPLLPP